MFPAGGRQGLAPAESHTCAKGHEVTLSRCMLSKGAKAAAGDRELAGQGYLKSENDGLNPITLIFLQLFQVSTQLPNDLQVSLWPNPRGGHKSATTGCSPGDKSNLRTRACSHRSHLHSYRNPGNLQEEPRTLLECALAEARVVPIACETSVCRNSRPLIYPSRTQAIPF